MAGYELRLLPELSTEARGHFVSAINGASVSVWPNTFTVTAKVMALLGFEHELRRAWLYRQIFISTSAKAALELHGYDAGVALDAGSYASGDIQADCTDGVVVPAGLRWVRADGASYRVMKDVGSSGGSVTMPVEAEDVGVDGNLSSGSVLTPRSDSVAPQGLASTGVVTSDGLVGGEDEEEIEAYRARLLDRRRNPPAGGSAQDYERWTKEALPAVRDVFVDSFADDTRTVWLQFTVDDRPNGIPTSAQVADVQDYVGSPVRRPVTARLAVSAPTPVEVPVTIDDLSPSSGPLRNAIAAELASAFTDGVEPGRPSAPWRLKKSLILTAIDRVAGDSSYTLVAPSTGLDFAAGQYPILGPVTFL